MIGARTLAVVGVSALAVALAAARGVLDPSHLAELEAASSILIGLFASLATVVAANVWHLDGRSVFGIGLVGGRVVAAATHRLGRDARDLPPSLQRVLYFVAFVCVGLVSFGPGSADRLSQAGRILGASGSDRCPDPAEVALEPPPAPPPQPVDQRGCALVRRAFELGYRKNLGNCAPKEATAAAPTERAAVPPCTRRQHDEPALHYAWRLLDDRVAAIESGAGGVQRATDELRIKLDYLPALTATTREAILATPRAAHHLWTDLPPPRDVGVFERVFGKNRCAARFGEEPPNLEWSEHARPESALLEAALGQLLHSPRHGTIAANCQEITIHWSADRDTCRRLADDPLDVLDDADAIDGVLAVLARHHSRNRRAALADELGRGAVKLRAPDARRVVSFQCLFTGDESPMSLAAPTEERGLTIDADGGEVALLVRERRMGAVAASGAGQLEIYRQLAALLAGGRYAGPVTESGAATRRPTPLPTNVLETSDFPLARLEFLTDADPFLGDTWPLERDDLTEVYPFEVHLRHFTEVFRRRYRNVRGRL